MISKEEGKADEKEVNSWFLENLENLKFICSGWQILPSAKVFKRQNMLKEWIEYFVLYSFSVALSKG